MLQARPRSRSRTRLHDCDLHIGFPKGRPRLHPNGAPLVRYITIIGLGQFPHHRHHVTHHADWGGGANEHALHPKVEPPHCSINGTVSPNLSPFLTRTLDKDPCNIQPRSYYLQRAQAAAIASTAIESSAIASYRKHPATGPAQPRGTIFLLTFKFSIRRSRMPCGLKS